MQPETGYPGAHASQAELAERLGLTDLQAEDLEELLDDLAGGSDDLAGADRGTRRDLHAARSLRMGRRQTWDRHPCLSRAAATGRKPVPRRARPTQSARWPLAGAIGAAPFRCLILGVRV